MTRCLFVSDLHGRPDRYEKLFRAIERIEPAGVFIGGDLLPHAFLHRSSGAAGPDNFISGFVASRLRALKKELADRYPAIFVILGNDDPKVDELPCEELTRERLRFGFLFQQAALFDSMTVAQNVAFPLRQHSSRPEHEIRQIVLARLSEVGLPASVLGKKPAELSGGMRKRVGLARALAAEPELMLYDEPTTGLDPIMADVINELILSTRQRHPVTSVVVTHDMRTTLKVADRVVMLYPLARLRPGEPQVIYDGPPGGLQQAADQRVRQFVEGEAGERLMELRQSNGG